MPQYKTFPRKFAYFISPHGFGHASRAAAVMSAFHNVEPSVHFEIFTLAPNWFFEQSLKTSYTYHQVKTDTGVIQKSALVEDLEATLLDLKTIYPLRQDEVGRLADIIIQTGCEAIFCDIAPMGIAVARQAGIPSVLIENFTWDWIYEGYLEEESRFSNITLYLKKLFKQADLHIQTDPLCEIDNNADLFAQPASRKPRSPASEIRSALEVPDNQKVVLITMGGIPENYDFLSILKKENLIRFIIPGNYCHALTDNNITVLPHHSQFYHPDLVNACDAVVGKLGYSTIAEIFHAGIPMLYLSRPRFRESPSLVRFVESHIPCAHIPTEELNKGNWLADLHKLLSFPRLNRNVPNGADQIVQFILNQRG